MAGRRFRSVSHFPLERKKSLRGAKRLFRGTQSGKDCAKAFFLWNPLAPAERRRFETKIMSLLKPQGEREAGLKKEVLSHRELRPAPPFPLFNLQGESVLLSSFHGRVLVLSFWASWCVPCIAEMTEVEEGSHRFARNPRVGFAGISVDRDRSLVESFVKRRGYTIPILLTGGSVEFPYKTGATPRLYVIDPQGRIRFSRGIAPFDGFQGKRLDWMIEAALKVKPATA